MTRALPEWDPQIVNAMIKERLNELRDRISRLMKREEALTNSLAANTLVAETLRTAISAMHAASGDTGSLQAKLTESETRIADEEPRLECLRSELRLVRECMRMADIAQDGSHWLCYAESDLDKHDRNGVWAPEWRAGDPIVRRKVTGEADAASGERAT